MTSMDYHALLYQLEFWTTLRISYGIMDHLPEYYQYPTTLTVDGTVIHTDSLDCASTLRISTAIDNAIREIDDVIAISVEPKSTGQVGDILFGVGVLSDGIRPVGVTAGPPGDGIGGDVWLQKFWYDELIPVPVPNSELFKTIVHEIGHAMGLSHPYGEGDREGFDDHFTIM